MSLTEEDFHFKSLDLPDKYMSKIDGILEDLDSNALQSLETSAANLPTPIFREGEGLTLPMYHKKSLSIINRTICIVNKR